MNTATINGKVDEKLYPGADAKGIDVNALLKLITANYFNKDDNQLVNSLTLGGATKIASAETVKQLKELLDGKVATNDLDGLVETIVYELLNDNFSDDAKPVSADLLVTANIYGTYANGTLGEGATITTFDIAFPLVDGKAAEDGKTYALISQANKTHNGVFQLAMDGVNPCVLTRIAEFNQPNEVVGAILTIQDGVTYANTIWLQKNNEFAEFGTDEIIFTQSKTTQSSQTLYLADTITTELPDYDYEDGTDPTRPGIGAKITMQDNGVFPTYNGINPTDYANNSLTYLILDLANPEHNGLYKLYKRGSATIKAQLVRSGMVIGSTTNKRPILISNSESTYYQKFFTCDNIDLTNAQFGIEPIEFSILASEDSNFANANLTFDDDHDHNLANHKLSFGAGGEKGFEFDSSTGATIVRGRTGAQGKLTVTSVTGLEPTVEWGYDSLGGGYQGRIVGSNGLVFFGQNSSTRTMQLTTTAIQLGGSSLPTSTDRFVIIPTGNTSADYLIRCRDAADAVNTFFYRADGYFFHASETHLQETSSYQAAYKLKGAGAARFDLANATNFGFYVYANAGLSQLVSAGTLMYTCRDGLTPGTNLDLNMVTFAYDDATDDFLIRFKKADGTVIDKPI